ncbi:hypothetical protein ScPMuIL_005770 [Solemya velum]
MHCCTTYTFVIPRHAKSSFGIRKSELTCVRTNATSSCPADQKMSIVSVFYGRLDKTTCFSPVMANTNWKDVTDTTTYVTNEPVLGN